ncbi:MAG TPA: LuxR C-terminal-related transcriptional regulator [Acidobacteriota bacterium]|nr:LuxR C-terminal-related transcriptional regulator [Acidobacteriota bacterium]
MKLAEIKEFVDSTLDAAFAVDPEGRIVAWNREVAELTGLSKEEAVGKPCGELIQGSDECGTVCSEDCIVRQAVSNKRPMKNFDMHIRTARGREWCNVSVLIVGRHDSAFPYAVHILRSIDVRKRLEMAMRDFIISETRISPEQAMAIVSSTRSPAQLADLTEREREVLRLIATTARITDIAKKLQISRTTLHNHIQHIFRKLDVHTRIEAVRRAERAGLL